MIVTLYVPWVSLPLVRVLLSTSVSVQKLRERQTTEAASLATQSQWLTKNPAVANTGIAQYQSQKDKVERYPYCSQEGNVIKHEKFVNK